jgi:YVTN family beta-propeller protein
VGTDPSGVAVTPDGKRVYVANRESGTVSVIHTATNTVAKTIPVGIFPNSVAVTPDGTKVYVVNNVSQARQRNPLPPLNTHFPAPAFSGVTVIARPGNAVVANIPVGINPVGVAIGP